jgi:hypothetical protein
VNKQQRAALVQTEFGLAGDHAATGSAQKPLAETGTSEFDFGVVDLGLHHEALNRP